MSFRIGVFFFRIFSFVITSQSKKYNFKSMSFWIFQENNVHIQNSFIEVASFT